MIYWKVTQQSQQACKDVRKQITEMTNALGIFFFSNIAFSYAVWLFFYTQTVF